MNIKESSLFKYRSINLNTLESIRDNYLFFNDPIKFNDPFDCRLNIYYEGNESEWESFFDAHEISMKERERLNIYFKKFNQFTSNKLNPLTRYKVLSLSEKNDEILLWSHYADEHKGICIEYKTKEILDEESPFHLMMFNPKYIDYKLNDSGINNIVPVRKVFYKKTLPEGFNVLKDPPQNIEKFIFTKYFKWKYEGEWRILIPKASLLKTNKVKLSNGFIKSIIFGLRADKKDILNVQTFLKQNPNYRSISISKAEINNNEYSINIKKYDSFEQILNETV